MLNTNNNRERCKLTSLKADPAWRRMDIRKQINEIQENIDWWESLIVARRQSIS